MEDLANLTDAKIDTLSFLHEHQPKKLKALCQACREGDPALIKDVLTRMRNSQADLHPVSLLLARLRER